MRNGMCARKRPRVLPVVAAPCRSQSIQRGVRRRAANSEVLRACNIVGKSEFSPVDTG
ncbi:hypothetical protein GLA29479_1553 [Lysobacter antibioticus]|nr:hypothetical protein GLA29479_1553 [Lysobacter antibioticus]